MKLTCNFGVALDVCITSLALVITGGFLSLSLLFYHSRESFSFLSVSDCDILTQGEEKFQNDFNSSATLVGINDSRFCRDDFYKDNSTGRCIPSCYTWSELSPSSLLITDGILITFYILRLSAAVLSVTVTCAKKRELIEFPSAFLLLMNMDIAIEAAVLLTSILGRNHLNCFSRNLLDTIQSKPPYCIISGVVLLYTTFQLILWWTFHVITFCWSVYFPFHYRSLEKTRKIHYINFIYVALGLLLPLIPIVSIMGSFAIKIDSTGNTSFWQGGAGFTQTGIPNYSCIGENKDVMYYSYVLPSTLIIMLACTLLIIIIRLIIKLALRKFKVKNSNKVFKFGTAEKKLIVLWIYYLILATVGLTSLTFTMVLIEDQNECLNSYFMCEENGHDPINPCNRSGIEQELRFGLTINFCYTLWPVFYLLMYVVEIKDFKTFWTKCRPRLRKVERNTNETELQQRQ